MINAVLRDIPGKKVHNLTGLMKENDDEISVGRAGHGNLIELGQDTTISRQHATITYLDIGKFCIHDHSTNGTRINEEIINAAKGYLRHGDKLWFGNYGPVVYEEKY
ncbi:MAG: FHA domain-containing protein [Nanoarchaeota archaeon]|nr:FHA domain-containing protein [Nanoarchaeota archaeon]